MSNSWLPPENVPPPPVWGPPQSAPTPPAWGPPQSAPTSWAPQYQQQYGYGMPQKTTDDKMLEWALPINRSGLAIAAGYVSLFSIFAMIIAPVGVLLGFLALRDIEQHPAKLGKGRAWFAIIFGGLLTLVMLGVAGYFVFRIQLGQ